MSEHIKTDGTCLEFRQAFVSNTNGKTTVILLFK